ncbi:hypothetical protein FA15DRAFT_583530 [Coprinopsis marcescibilis]|uniref:Uncharacterized protein n=1 Tax=Coprinopsis marcescibilis TaxID=230819 RepID=A0A5C3L7M0_COPMA|nr:hypothetical protein FA15DRAFT_583530 [Coprinopsis marcescibilis]
MLQQAKDTKVSVQLGVMSQCPDALLCESVFKDVVNNVADKIDLSLVYVARLDPFQNKGVWCLHGPQECEGNIQQLCVAKYTPFSKWWEFVQCQNYQGRYKIGLPSTALQCAEATHIDWEGSGAQACAEGDEGIQLLKDSIKLGNRLNITKSCTVLINEQKICVHDSTWKECENGHSVKDFVKQIEEEYGRLNSV